MPEWHEHADPFDRLIALLREVWADLNDLRYSSADILIMLGIIALIVKHAPNLLVGVACIAWLIFKRFTGSV